MDVLTTLLLIWSLFTLGDGQKFCTASVNLGGAYTTKVIYCEDTCCGDYNNQQCCSSSDSGLIIGIVITSAVFILLAIALAICCMKNTTRKQTRVAVIHITETQHAAARRDERREERRRQRMEEMATIGGHPHPNMPQYAPVDPPAYSFSMYGEDSEPPGAYGGPSDFHVPSPYPAHPTKH